MELHNDLSLTLSLYIYTIDVIFLPSKDVNVL